MSNFCSMKSIFFKLIFILFFGALSASANDICSDQLLKNETANTMGYAFDKFDWSVLDRQLVVIGDNHAYTSPDDIFAIEQRLPQIQRGKACLFLEFPISIDIETFKQKLNIDPDDSEQKAYIQYYRQIVNQAESLGLQIHLVDHPDNFKQEQTMSLRNTTMAANIKNLFDSSICSSGIQIVGEAHIAPDDDTFGSIRDSITNLELTNAAINFVYATKLPLSPNLEKWNFACNEKSFVPSSSVIFSSVQIKDLPLWPKYSQKATYGYFDYTILVP